MAWQSLLVIRGARIRFGPGLQLPLPRRQSEYARYTHTLEAPLMWAALQSDGAADAGLAILRPTASERSPLKGRSIFWPLER